jgi:inner membrane protein
VDPLTHSLTGAALSRAGLNRTTPLATATLVLAANAPDIDIVASAAGSYTSLAFRRGITHGPLAMLLLPLAVAGAVLLYDRVRRRRGQPDAPSVRAVPTLGLAALGVLSHPLLDWMNTYGIRLLMPLSDRWFYGDSLFIIDPWAWLMLAAPLVAVYAGTRRRQVAWAVLAVAATALVMLVPMVPVGARVLWAAALAAVLAHALRVRRRGSAEPVTTRGARVALAALTLYVAGMVAADQVATWRTYREALAAGIPAAGTADTEIMVAPVPANPFSGDVVVATGQAYHTGRFHWFRTPHVLWDDEPIPLGERDQVVFATLQLQDVRNFLRWSRFPFVAVVEGEDGYVVRFGDARYPAQRMRGGLGGITVEVERSLRARNGPD